MAKDPECVYNFALGLGPPGRLSGLSVYHSISGFYGAFVRAHRPRTLSHPKVVVLDGLPI